MNCWQSALLATSVGFGFLATAANANVIAPYFQQNLVSDVPGLAPVTDPNLQNPWGVSESSASPLWVSDQHANVSTLYTIQGLNATPVSLVVPFPTQPTPPNGPTGQVNNSTSLFLTNQSGASSPAHFIFANLNGGIYAWAAAGNPAAVAVPPAPGNVYSGLAIGGSSSSTPFLYAANVAQGRIDVFDGTFTNVTNTAFAGKFVDPVLPAGLVPFNVQTIGGFGGNIYVTYAPGGPPANQSGATIGQGAVAIFKPDGTFVEQLIAGTANGSRLAAPWGITLAPANFFGPFSGDLLVGNFAYGNLNGIPNPGGGEIDAYNPLTGAFLGTLDSNVAWQGLWALTFGNNGSGGSSDILYFTTGLNSETDGLLAALAVPEPGTLALLGMGALSLCVVRRRRSSAGRFM
jgi:uncharacterized protein (TIGR03118 family)